MKLTEQKTKWKYPQMGEVCNFIGGSQPPKSEFIFEPKNGYIRLLQIRDYKSDKNTTYIPQEKARRFCSKDDIMIGRYGPPLFQILRGLEGAYRIHLRSF
jgi:type I restriction enzyme, S subunit